MHAGKLSVKWWSLGSRSVDRKSYWTMKEKGANLQHSRAVNGECLHLMNKFIWHAHTCSRDDRLYRSEFSQVFVLWSIHTSLVYFFIKLNCNLKALSPSRKHVRLIWGFPLYRLLFTTLKLIPVHACLQQSSSYCCSILCLCISEWKIKTILGAVNESGSQWIQIYSFLARLHIHSWRMPIVSRNTDDGVLDVHSKYAYTFLTILYGRTFCVDQSGPVLTNST